MNILFIDLASHEGSLACVTEHKVSHVGVDHRLGDHEIMPRIEDVLQKQQWTLEELTHIACVTGPGGFTSLRMAVAFANILSDQLRIPVAGIHLSDLWAARALDTRHQTPDTRKQSLETENWKLESFLWVHSTKSTSLFVRGFGDFSSRWPEPTFVTLDELLQECPDATPCIGELIPAHKESLKGKLMPVDALWPVEEVLPKFLSTQDFKHQQLQPWYGRGW